jgi:hypothetical protein
VERKAATRAQILQSALMCFSEKGFHQTTMDDIVFWSKKAAIFYAITTRCFGSCLRRCF